MYNSDKKKIIIITGTGGILGTGHFQRMLNLAVGINKEKDLSALIFLQNNEHGACGRFGISTGSAGSPTRASMIAQRPSPLPNGILTEDIPQNADLIIRDMRDSSVDEIKNLKTKATVLTIDDIGEGKNFADHKLYLLPASSKNIKLNHNLFLYGYNFIYGMELLKEKNSIKKDIEITIYLGYDPDKEIISKIKKSIPNNLSAILLANNEAISLTGREISKDIQYSEILCRSKIVITHFGITMFEAHICQCKIAALNPSAYHNTLTDLIYEDFNILYRSDYTTFTLDEMFNIIGQNLKIIDDKVIYIDNILKRITSNNENFIKYIKDILFM